MTKQLQNIHQKYRNVISSYTTIMEALKVMNDTNINLLVVIDDEKFAGLLSIGDIRRAILDNHDINALSIDQIMRSDVLVSRPNDPIHLIKKLMLDKQIVCMPIVDEEYNLRNIYYWDDLFGTKKALQPLDVEVVIMAGGRGSRLKPITNIIPKPLVPVGERPIIEIIIDNFMRHKVKNFYISVNYKAKMIEDYLKEKESPKCRLHYFIEEKPLGTIGSLHLIRDQLHKSIFVSNCDIIIDEDYAEIYQFHKENHNDITIVSAVKHVSIPYGVMETAKGGKLISMTEKPEFTFQVNTGMYIFEPHVLHAIPDNLFYHITDLIAKVNQTGKVGVFPVTEKAWYDIGQWKEYQDTLINYK